ncbi:MAG: YhjD/YihY/BrkB family envelope integrity protein [Ktedonobacterales bacterium]
MEGVTGRTARAGQAEQRDQASVGVLHGLWRKFDRDWGWNLARLLAFTILAGLFAVAGLELLLLALALRLGGPQMEQSVTAHVIHLLPDRVSATAVADFTRSLRTAPVWLLLLGLPVALWYSSRFFVVLESVLCVIFRRTRRRFLAQNRVAFLMLLLLGALFPIIVFSATLAPHLDLDPLPTYAHVTRLSDNPYWAMAGLLAGMGANFLLLFIAFTRLTPGRIAARAAWPGALLGAALAQGYLLIFPLYAHYILQPDHFGTVAGFAFVALTFFYAYGIFIVVGAEVAAWRTGYSAGAGDVTELLAASAQAATPTASTLLPIPSRKLFPATSQSSRWRIFSIPATPAASQPHDPQHDAQGDAAPLTPHS